jgi:hypothetical protein
MISTQSRRQRKAALTALLAGTLGIAAVIVTPTPAAFAESAESPTGMVTVSVPPPVLAGVPSTYNVNQTPKQPGTLSSGDTEMALVYPGSGENGSSYPTTPGHFTC